MPCVLPRGRRRESPFCTPATPQTKAIGLPGAPMEVSQAEPSARRMLYMERARDGGSRYTRPAAFRDRGPIRVGLSGLSDALGEPARSS